MTNRNSQYQSPLHSSEGEPTESSHDDSVQNQQSPIGTYLGIAGFLILFAVAVWALRAYFDLGVLAEQEESLNQMLAQSPVLFFAAAFGIYAAFTGLSVPGASVVSLTYAWFFGFWKALLIISFASTLGATIALLTSRYLIAGFVERKFGSRMLSVNEAIAKEGAFYLFSLRLMAVIPFLVVNLMMGLTKIKVSTYWWVSQLGMLPGTAAYVYAGSRVPSLKELNENGISSIFSSSQLTQLAIAFATIGLMPLVIKKLIERFRDQPDE